MEYKVVEVKWLRDGNFVGTPPISNNQTQLTRILTSFARKGWTVVNIRHDVDDRLRFSIITLSRDSTDEPESESDSHSDTHLDVESDDSSGVPIQPKTIKEHVRDAQASDPAPLAAVMPLTNGLYVCRDELSDSFLRFYDDGRVITTSTEAGALVDKVAEWFSWDKVETSGDLYVDGDYSVTGNHLEFSTTSDEGTVSYSGTIVSPTEIKLKSHSDLNAYVANETYLFVQVRTLD